ncbi:MAG: lipoprotein [Acidobacteriia bacterium]|nr:lipoprotein [Terriglobia bacterium]
MRKLFVAILALAFLAGCSSEPTKPATAEKPQPKAPEAITGESALYKCYVPARGWAQDAQPFRVESEMTGNFKGRDGKAGSWRIGFASPAQRSVKPYTWSNGEVSPGVEDTYSPSNVSTQVFNIQFLKVDSDKALEAAQKHGGDKLIEKEPDTPINYLLDWNRQKNELTWHVIYGTDRDSAKLRVAVNASTGDFLRVEK